VIDRYGHGANQRASPEASAYDLELPRENNGEPRIEKLAIQTFTSVDEAIHSCSGNPELVQLGKSEIVRQIIRREASSALKLDLITERPALENVREKWYPEFLSLALAGLRKDALKSALQNVTIVNFNYDRTLEQYLYWALQTTSVTAEEAAG
jgi:hypothetical protein